MKTLIIHPGYRKSATTYLQDEVFKKIDANFLAKPISDNKIRNTNYYKLFKSEFFKYSDYNELKKENYLLKIKEFEKELEKNLNNKKKITLLSDEGFLGNSHFNGINNIFLLSRLLEKLKKKYKFDVKIILTIRNQFDLIRSNYFFNEYFHKNFTLSNYYKFVLKRNNKGEDLNYNFKALTDILGETITSKIFILPMENLEIMPKKTLKKLCSFISIKYENKKFKVYKKNINHLKDRNNLYYNKLTTKDSWIERKLKKIFQHIKKIKILYQLIIMFKINYFLKKIFFKSRFKKVLYENKNNIYKNKIKNKYKKFNIELNKKFKLNLKELNYY